MAWPQYSLIALGGAYTTFGTFGYGSAQIGSSWQAMSNLIGSVIVGYGCVWLGIRLAHLVSAAHGSAVQA